MKTALTLAVLLVAGAAHAQSSAEAYGVATIATAARPSTTITLNTATGSTVSSTALDIARVAQMVRVRCSTNAFMTITPGVTGTVSIVTTTAVPVIADAPEVFVMLPSSTIAFRADTAAGVCNVTRMMR